MNDMKVGTKLGSVPARKEVTSGGLDPYVSAAALGALLVRYDYSEPGKVKDFLQKVFGPQHRNLAISDGEVPAILAAARKLAEATFEDSPNPTRPQDRKEWKASFHLRKLSDTLKHSAHVFAANDSVRTQMLELSKSMWDQGRSLAIEAKANPPPGTWESRSRDYKKTVTAGPELNLHPELSASVFSALLNRVADGELKSTLVERLSAAVYGDRAAQGITPTEVHRFFDTYSQDGDITRSIRELNTPDQVATPEGYAAMIQAYDRAVETLGYVISVTDDANAKEALEKEAKYELDRAIRPEPKPNRIANT